MSIKRPLMVLAALFFSHSVALAQNRIQGNQIILPGGRRTILLLNSKYLIFSEGDTVFFHSRVSD